TPAHVALRDMAKDVPTRLDPDPAAIPDDRAGRSISAAPPSLLPHFARRPSCIATAGGGRVRPAGNPLHNKDRYREAARRAEALQLGCAQLRRSGAVDHALSGKR